MAPVSLTAVVERAADRAIRDPRFADVLAAIVDAPTDDAGELTRLAAGRLNDSRRRTASEDFRASAVTTAQVQRLLDRSSPQAVHVLRSRGRLLGRTIGNATYFPAWQFTGGEIRGDLPAVLSALRRVTDDALTADRIMRLRRDELNGTSLAEALDHPRRAAAAWNILGDLGAGH